jgi:ABC-2 type transport system permease protein
MKTLKKYFTIFSINYAASISRDIAYRVNFILGLFGAFCFVGMNYFLIIFLFQKISLGPWSQREMLVFLGNFYIIWYAIFFLFYRGFVYLIRYIRNGLFDYYLIRPVDTQFLVSVIGGGVHNLLAIFFGLGLLIFGLFQLQSTPAPINIILWVPTMIVAILDCYSFIFLLVLLNFRYGYLEEILNLAFSVQEFSRYPVDAFTRLPVIMLLFSLPFSFITTTPTLLLINSAIPLRQVIIFIIVSLLFIVGVRRMWIAALKNYSSFA